MARLRKRQIVFRMFTLIGLIAIGSGLFLWLVGEEYSEGGLAVLIMGILIILLIFVVAPILDPESPRGLRRAKVLQQSDVRRLQRKKIPQLICHIFDAYIRHYPRAFKESPERVPPSIEACWEENGLINMLYNGKEFAFRFTEWELGEEAGQPQKHGQLELYKNGRKRLEILMDEDIDSHYLPYWKPRSITYLDYGYGTWIKDLKRFFREARRAAFKRGQQPFGS